MKVMLPAKTNSPSFCSLPAVLRRAISLGLAFALLAGCTTYQPTSPAEAQRIIAQIRPGDTVTVTLRSGITRNVKVTAIESGWLVGEPNAVFLGDAVRIEIRSREIERMEACLPGLVLVGAAAYLCTHPPIGLPRTN
ncbi:MAG: hypothetical protein HZC55_19350 [Verrucomicrobia bacterium]|nr:hypothetical protein [Verrucomicrobiota bacterium]